MEKQTIEIGRRPGFVVLFAMPDGYTHWVVLPDGRVIIVGADVPPMIYEDGALREIVVS